MIRIGTDMISEVYSSLIFFCLFLDSGRIFVVLCYVHPIFWFWFLVTFEVKKIRKYYVIFAYILQGKIGKTKKTKKNHATKVTKIPQTKRRKYGMNETLVICHSFVP